jgi:CRP-like cAMP-binding protein
MSFTEDKRHNQILATLTDDDWGRWLSALELVHLKAGNVVTAIGEKLQYVYFPTTAILSLTHLLREGGTIEIAMVGSEGMSGFNILLGGGFSTQQVVVLHSGKAYRLKSSWITDELQRTPKLMHQILRFTQALFTQISQVGACNRHHPLEQQLSRWLLSYADRTNANIIFCTQETIANRLGVRRERVARAAINFQKNGLIEYSRGEIKILNRIVLEKNTCECYATVKLEYERLRA